MAKRQKMFKFVPLNNRNIFVSLFAFVVAIALIALASLLWYAIFTNSSDGSTWMAAIATTTYAACSSMAVITGVGEWLTFGLLYW